MAQYQRHFDDRTHAGAVTDLFTAEWATAQTWEYRVLSKSIHPGRSAIRVSGGSDGREAYTLDEAGSVSDAQVLALVRVSGSTLNEFYQGVAARVGGSAGSENAYVAEIVGNRIGANNDTLRLAKYVGGVATDLGYLTPDLSGIPANTWFWILLECTGTTIRTKYWQLGTAEPGSWDISVTDSSLASGKVGLFNFESNQNKWTASLRVGTGGDAAPRGPVKPIPPRLKQAGPESLTAWSYLEPGVVDDDSTLRSELFYGTGIEGDWSDSQFRIRTTSGPGAWTEGGEVSVNLAVDGYPSTQFLSLAAGTGYDISERRKANGEWSEWSEPRSIETSPSGEAILSDDLSEPDVDPTDDPPAGWSNFGDNNDNFPAGDDYATVFFDAGARVGFLRDDYDGSSGNQRHLLLVDGESASYGSIAIHCGASQAYEAEFRVGVNPGLRIYRWDGGASRTELASTGVLWDPNENVGGTDRFFWIEMERSGSSVRARYWSPDSAVPAWGSGGARELTVASDTTHQDGKPGIFVYNAHSVGGHTWRVHYAEMEGVGVASPSLPKPDTPSIVEIVEEPLGAQVNGSTYSYSSLPFSGHADTQVQVDESGGDFSTPVADVTTGGDTLGAPVTGLTELTSYIARLRYRAANNQWSDWSATVAFTTLEAVEPDTPTLTVLAKDDSTVRVGTSAYNQVNGVPLNLVRWEIELTAGDFSTPEAVLETPAAAHPPWEAVIAGLTPDTGYKARVRHQSEEGVNSAWSGTVAFATDPEPGAERPSKPTIAVVGGSITSSGACFTSSAYSSPVSSPHASSEWGILTDPAQPNAFFWRFTSASELVAFCTSSSAVGLAQNYNHGAVVRHFDSGGRASSWSDPVSLTTLARLDGPRFTAPDQGAGLAADTVYVVSWDDSPYSPGTTFDVELSIDFGETYTAYATALSIAQTTFDTSDRTVGFGYVFRVRANDPTNGVSPWGYLSLGIVAGQGVTKTGPFDISEWSFLYDTHRAVWQEDESSMSLRVHEPGTILSFPAGSGVLPQHWHDYALAYHPDFGQPIDCDIAVQSWQKVITGYTLYGWKTKSEENQPIGVGIMGLGTRQAYETVPPGDANDPKNSYFTINTGLIGIMATWEIESPWQLSELPPAFYFAGSWIPDFANNNFGCESTTYNRRLGWGAMKVRLRVLDGGADELFDKTVTLGESPVSDDLNDETWRCNGQPKYELRMAVRTINIRENGNRDLRIRVAVTGPGGKDGRWIMSEVVENVPISCGFPGAVSRRLGSPGFGRAASMFDRISVIGYDYGTCALPTFAGESEPAESEDLPSVPSPLCPDPGEAATNPPLYMGIYYDADSAGFLEGASVVLYSKSNLDVDQNIPCRVTTREIAPRGTRGDSLFRNVYLVVSGQSHGLVTVTPIVDGQERTDCARSFVVDWDPDIPDPPFVRRYEIALYEEIGADIGRRGLRGTHFKLKVEVFRTWECGILRLDGFELEYDEATERHNELVEVPEPWIKAAPYDTAHVLFGRHFAEDSAGTNEPAELLEYGGNPSGESAFVQDDDGIPIDFNIRSREIAPYGVRGDAIFTNLYVAFLRYNTAEITVNVIPVVDGTEHDAIAVVLPPASAPILDVREVSLAQDILDPNGNTVGRRALRGTWFQVEFDIPAGVSGGLVYMESRGVEVAPATEDELPVANA